jgi:hypothetical protein
MSIADCHPSTASAKFPAAAAASASAPIVRRSSDGNGSRDSCAAGPTLSSSPRQPIAAYQQVRLTVRLLTFLHRDAQSRVPDQCSADDSGFEVKSEIRLSKSEGSVMVYG